MCSFDNLAKMYRGNELRAIGSAHLDRNAGAWEFNFEWVASMWLHYGGWFFGKPTSSSCILKSHLYDYYMTNKSHGIKQLVDSKITLSRLDAFRRFAEFGTIREAAGGDLIRQNQFSRQIKELEDASGLTLVLRDKRRLHLTEHGKELARLTESFFGAFLDLQESESGFEEVRVVAGASVIHGIFMPRLAELHRVFPKKSFVFEGDTTEGILQGLNSGRYEIGVFAGAVKPKGFVALEIGKMDYVAVTPKGLNKKEPKTWKAFLAQPFATRSGTGRFSRNLNECREVAGVDSALTFKAYSFKHVQEMIESGVACGILPRIFEFERPAKYHLQSFKALAVFEQNLWIVYNENSATVRPSIEKMAKHLQRIVLKAT